MSSLDSLHKRVDRMLAQERQLLPVSSSDERVAVQLPIKDGKPSVGYQDGRIYFYVPEHRQEEGFTL